MREFVAIDLEMTGLNPKRDALLEVGAVKVCDHQVKETLCFFVNSGRTLSEEVMALTGISQSQADSGISPGEAIRQVAGFTEGQVLVGHNVMFDYSFLKQLAVNERIPFERKAVDTLKLARKLLEKPEKKSLDCLCGYFGIRRTHAHRALEDAFAAWRLYEYLERAFFSENEKAFEPKPLQYKPKRQTPASPAQKKHLKELMFYHKIDIVCDIESLTRSEASRLTDQIICQYGRIAGRRASGGQSGV